MKYFLNNLAIIFVLLAFSSTTNAQEKKDLIKPNIIIFYVDDLGWQDTEINNLDEPSPWETPNITKLAKDGMNFTNGYSPAPTCAPSRCAILSGLHPTKTGVTHVSGGVMPTASRRSNYMAPFFPIGLKTEHYTIAEALKENGYRTGHVGKWHVGDGDTESSTTQGFDFAHESRGAHQGPRKPDNRLTAFATHDENDKYRLSDEKYAPFTKEFPNGISYPKDAVTENALKFIDESKDQPFFLYLAQWLVHAPIHTKNKALLQHYSDKLSIDFPTKNIPIRTGGQTNPFYGSMVTTLDWSLGRVVDLLKKTDDPRNPGKKLYETTYIFFSSDNGAVEKANGDVVTDNAPLDEGKKYAQEGGIRVPMVVSGPNIPKGKTYDGLVNQLDFFPTILNLTNSKVPTKYSSEFDGLNITGVLQNNAKDIKNNKGEIREDLWWHFPHNQDHQMQSAIRSGDYKLYKNHLKGNYELYRLYENGKRGDLEEKLDIAKQSPNVVKELSKKLEKYLRDYDAKYPYKDPSKIKGDSENVASVPKIKADIINKESSSISVTLKKGQSKVIESYGLVSFKNLNQLKRDGKPRKVKAPYERIELDYNKDKLEYTLNLPKGATNAGIIFIDENRFMVKSKFHLVGVAKSSKKMKNKGKNKKGNKNKKSKGNKNKGNKVKKNEGNKVMENEGSKVMKNEGSKVMNINTQNNNDLIKPNIIIFYADDLGWQDVELNDLDEPCGWDTPNIKALAKDAINFTNAYSPAPTCGPSRAALLTGLHPAKTGVTQVAGGTIPKSNKRSKYISPFFPSGLMPDHFTIAEALKMNGYKTGHTGKWHVGALKIQSSKNQGFDFTHESRGAHQGPKRENNRTNFFATHDTNDKYRLSEEKYFPSTTASPNGISYPTDAVTENALQFIRDNKEEPFFLYLAHWMVHYPIHSKNRELLQYYCDKFGMEFPTEDVPMTKGGQSNPYFGAMVTTLDWSLGRVIDLLKKTDDPRNPGKKLYETTYIFFSSDNGGAESRKDEVMSDNAPLDKGKKYTEEGGIRVPMLVSGPNIPKGKTNDVLINQLDYYPTILNLTNSKIPTEYSSDFDGLDISNVLYNNENTVKNSKGISREDLWWHYPYGVESQNQSAIRSGDYKLYKKVKTDSYVLHRLYKDGKRHDLEEQHDIAKQEPEVVKALSEKLEKNIKDYDAELPYKDPSKFKNETENIAALPNITTDNFDASSRKVSIELEKGKSQVENAYVLIKIGNPIKASKNGKKRKEKKHSTTYIKIPVDASNDKLAYTVTLPKESREYIFIATDENRFMVKGELHKIN